MNEYGGRRKSVAVKFKRIKLENGTEIQAYVDKGSGIFSAEFMDKAFRKESFKELVVSVTKYAGNTAKLKFKPMIEIRVDVFLDRSGMGFGYDREFHAIMQDGTVAVRTWSHLGEIPKGMDSWHDCVEGEPGGGIREINTTSRDSFTYIPYTVKKWQALRLLEKEFDLVKDRLKEVLTGEDNERFLEAVSKNTIKLLEGEENKHNK